MHITITKDDVDGAWVDRDGVLNAYNRQGVDIRFDTFYIHFEDEQDATQLADLIRQRVLHVPDPPMPVGKLRVESLPGKFAYSPPCEWFDQKGNLK